MFDLCEQHTKWWLWLKTSDGSMVLSKFCHLSRTRRSMSNSSSSIKIQSSMVFFFLSGLFLLLLLFVCWRCPRGGYYQSTVVVWLSIPKYYMYLPWNWMVSSGYQSLKFFGGDKVNPRVISSENIGIFQYPIIWMLYYICHGKSTDRWIYKTGHLGLRSCR